MQTKVKKVGFRLFLGSSNDLKALKVPKDPKDFKPVGGTAFSSAVYRSIRNEPICFTRSSKSSRSCFALFLTLAR